MKHKDDGSTLEEQLDSAREAAEHWAGEFHNVAHENEKLTVMLTTRIQEINTLKAEITILLALMPERPSRTPEGEKLLDEPVDDRTPRQARDGTDI
jgi:hypothetical protein